MILEAKFGDESSGVYGRTLTVATLHYEDKVKTEMEISKALLL